MNKRVLIVDDSDSVVVALGLLFESKGFTPINNKPVTSVAGAVQMTQIHKPDIILLDHQIGDYNGNGLDIAKTILANGALILSTSTQVTYFLDLTDEYRKAGVKHFPGKMFKEIMKCINNECDCLKV